MYILNIRSSSSAGRHEIVRFLSLTSASILIPCALAAARTSKSCLRSCSSSCCNRASSVRAATSSSTFPAHERLLARCTKVKPPTYLDTLAWWFREKRYFLIGFVVTSWHYAVYLSSLCQVLLATVHSRTILQPVVYITSHAMKVFPISIPCCPMIGTLHSFHQVRPPICSIPTWKIKSRGNDCLPSRFFFGLPGGDYWKMCMGRRTHARARHFHCQRLAWSHSAR